MAAIYPYDLWQNYSIKVTGTSSDSVYVTSWYDPYTESKPAKPKTNVDWLRERVDEMRVKLQA